MILSPQPADDYLNCRFLTKGDGREIQFSIFDINGRQLVKFQKPNNSDGISSFKIDLRELEIGFYLLQVIVKQKNWRHESNSTT